MTLEEKIKARTEWKKLPPRFKRFLTALSCGMFLSFWLNKGVDYDRYVRISQNYAGLEPVDRNTAVAELDEMLAKLDGQMLTEAMELARLCRKHGVIIRKGGEDG